MNRLFAVAVIAYSSQALELTRRGDNQPREFMGKSYFEKTAQEKFDLMWEHLMEDTTGLTTYFYDQMANLFEQDMSPSTCAAQDVIQNRMYNKHIPEEDQKQRHKLLHTFGIVGAVEYQAATYSLDGIAETDGVQYTGMFEGAKHGVMRLSETGFMLEDVEHTQIYSPSVAIKFFADGKYSANMLFQVSFDGIEDPWFFAENFTNHPPRSTNDCHQQTVERKFAEATDFIYSNGTGQWAEMYPDGKLIDEDKVILPYELILVPNREAFPDDGNMDFRDFLTNPAYQPAEGEKIKLFDVLASYNPEDDVPSGERQQIGQINLTSPMTRSLFGDEFLFFQHENYMRDLRKLSKQDDIGEAREALFREAVDKRKRKIEGEVWGDTPINDLPYDIDAAREIIEDGILDANYGCPFKWLLQ